jgi:hypothetical protein
MVEADVWARSDGAAARTAAARQGAMRASRRRFMREVYTWERGWEKDDADGAKGRDRSMDARFFTVVVAADRGGEFGEDYSGRPVFDQSPGEKVPGGKSPGGKRKGRGERPRREKKRPGRKAPAGKEKAPTRVEARARSK